MALDSPAAYMSTLSSLSRWTGRTVVHVGDEANPTALSLKSPLEPFWPAPPSQDPKPASGDERNYFPVVESVGTDCGV
jgi:hypothetical protein